MWMSANGSVHRLGDALPMPDKRREIFAMRYDRNMTNAETFGAESSIRTVEKHADLGDQADSKDNLRRDAVLFRDVSPEKDETPMDNKKNNISCELLLSYMQDKCGRKPSKCRYAHVVVGAAERPLNGPDVQRPADATDRIRPRGKGARAPQPIRSFLPVLPEFPAGVALGGGGITPPLAYSRPCSRRRSG